MTQTTTFKTLFKVNVLHQYFLNKGNSNYFSMSESDQLKQFNAYNINRVFQIIPHYETIEKMRGYNLIFKMVNDGFVVMAKVSEIDTNLPFVSIEDDFNLIFLIQLIDPNFYHYTGLDLSDTGKVSYFSNRQHKDELNTFPLINIRGDNVGITANYLLSDKIAINEFEKLAITKADRLFGIFRIFMKADNSDLDVLTSEGKIPTHCQTFEVLFENRKTLWRYIFNQNQPVLADDDVEIEGSDLKILVSKKSHPLTEKGFISINLGTVELPNPNINMIVPDEVNDKIYSEIYM